MAGRDHEVLALRRLTPETFALRFAREGLAFRAGQHVAVSLPGSLTGPSDERDYSLYGGERDPWLEILVREVPGGVLSPRLGRLRPGDTIRVGPPLGGFVLDSGRAAGAPLLFVATGTGVAPFRSMFRTHPDLPARLIHGVRHAAEAYDRADLPSDRYALCLSRERSTDAWSGRVTDWLAAHPVAPETHVYLCGNAAMIDDAMALLEAQGVPPHHLSTEIYF